MGKKFLTKEKKEKDKYLDTPSSEFKFINPTSNKLHRFDLSRTRKGSIRFQGRAVNKIN